MPSPPASPTCISRTMIIFEAKSPALNFFCAVPYGLTADELVSWIVFGGGQALWDEVDAQFNIKPLMARNTGVQMGGWFNKPNVRALRLLRADERIKIRRFNDELIKAFGQLSKEVLADTAAKDPLTRKVYDSYMTFLAGVMDWGELSETGYRDTRRLALA